MPSATAVPAVDAAQKSSLDCRLVSAPASAQEFTVEQEDVKGDEPAYSPYVDRNIPDRLFFGDTHHHTSIAATREGNYFALLRGEGLAGFICHTEVFVTVE